MNHNQVQAQRAGAIAGGRILAENACQSTQPAREKEVPTKIVQISNCIEALESAAAAFIDGVRPVMGPQHPEPEGGKLVGGQIGEASEMGGALEVLRARVQEVTYRLQSAHSRLEV